MDDIISSFFGFSSLLKHIISKFTYKADQFQSRSSLRQWQFLLASSTAQPHRTMLNSIGIAHFRSTASRTALSRALQNYASKTLISPFLSLSHSTGTHNHKFSTSSRQSLHTKSQLNFEHNSFELNKLQPSQISPLQKQPQQKLTHPVLRIPIIRILPRFAKKLIVNFYQEPISSLFSFLIVYEIYGLVPFLSIWYCLHNYEFLHFLSSGSLLLPDWMLIKGTEVIDKLLRTTSLVETFSVKDTTRLMLDGAKAFAVTQSLFPIRAALAFMTMGPFTRVFIRPIRKLFSKNGKDGTNNGDGTGKSDDEIWKTGLDNDVKFKKLSKKRL